MQHQYTGTAGRIENSQVAVFLAYATDAGHVFIDRELYLPKVWAADPDRRAATGVPAERVFATKGKLAARMVGPRVGRRRARDGLPGTRSTAKVRTCGPN